MTASPPPTRPGPWRTARRDLAIALGMAWRGIRWPAAAVAGLMLAALMAWGLAVLGYQRKKDDFPDFRDRERARASSNVLNQLRGMGTEFGNPWSLPLGIVPGSGSADAPATRLAISNRFDRAEDGLWRNRSAPELAAVAGVDAEGRLTRYHLTFRSLETFSLDGHYTLFRTVLGDPDATAGEVPGTTVPEVMVWRFEDRIFTLEVQSETRRTWVLRLNAIHDRDQRFALRWARGGLGVAHPQGDEIMVQLAKDATAGQVQGIGDDQEMTPGRELEEGLLRGLPRAPAPDSPAPFAPSPFEPRPSPPSTD